MAGFLRSTGKIASNGAAQVNGLFKFLGIGDDTRAAAKRLSKNVKTAVGSEMKDIGKRIGALDDNIKNTAKNIASRSNSDAGTVNKHLSETYGKYKNQADSLTNEIRGSKIEDKNQAAAVLNARREELTQGAISDIISKHNISQEEATGLFNNMKTRDSLINAQSGVASNALGSPLNLAKTYMLEGGPLATYAKGAALVTAGQFMNGSRTSLTEQNGQRDIAGVPFF